mmetsp:Transcript_2127/g.4510  ORF Transcript_2127/g.4510 Transcript_2127/m.4510 type:complete len:87 (-) Transcript_2127:200-460(-)
MLFLVVVAVSCSRLVEMDNFDVVLENSWNDSYWDGILVGNGDWEEESWEKEITVSSFWDCWEKVTPLFDVDVLDVDWDSNCWNRKG